MKNAVSFRSRLLLVILLWLILAVATIKVLSLRTYDRDNPRSRPNAYLMSHTVMVDKTPAEVFHFITYRMKDYNLSIAEAHDRFEILNADALEEGAIFIAEEYQEDEGVINRYEVKKVIPDQYIYYASTPSRIYRKKNGEMKPAGTCNAYVYFDLEPLGQKTKLTQTLVIEMPNFFIKFLVDLVAAREEDNEWQKHLVEELEGLKLAIEAEEPEV